MQVARADDDLRDERQRAVELREHRLEFRDEKRQQHNQHDDRQHKQNAGIQHRRHDLRFQVLFARLKFRDLRQHHVEKPARLARLDHRDINARKCFRRFRHRVGQRHAVHDGVVNFLPFDLGRRRRGFLGQNLQRAAQRHARRQQAGQEPREIFQFPRRNFFRLEIELDFSEVAQPAGQPRTAFCGGGFFRQGHRAQAERFHLSQRVGPVRGVKLSLGDLAVGLQAFVSERGHVFLGSSQRDFPDRLARFVFRRFRDFLGSGHTQDFIHRGDAHADQPPSVLGEHFHALFSRGLADRVG